MNYDVIGDLHGHAAALEALLARMGYRKREGAWRHPDRTAVFVGDFIDRGPSSATTGSPGRRRCSRTQSPASTTAWRSAGSWLRIGGRESGYWT